MTMRLTWWVGVRVKMNTLVNLRLTIRMIQMTMSESDFNDTNSTLVIFLFYYMSTFYYNLIIFLHIDGKCYR